MTHRPNPVQSIGQHRQQFSQPQYQPQQAIWQAPPQQQMASAEQQVQQQMHELSLEIYSRLATRLLTDEDRDGRDDPDRLRDIAKDAQLAARAYFESMGVQFAEGVTNGQS